MEQQNNEVMQSEKNSQEIKQNDSLSEILSLLRMQINQQQQTSNSSTKTSPVKGKSNSWIFFVLSIVINISILFGYHYFYATKIKVYDMNKFVRKMQEDILSGKVDQKSAEKRIKDVADQIRQVPPKTVVLFEDMVIHNGEKINVKDGMEE